MFAVHQELLHAGQQDAVLVVPRRAALLDADKGES